MQSTHKIAGADAQGFATYLTSSSARGDYYLGAQAGRSTGLLERERDGPGVSGADGRWHGSDAALASLSLSRETPVSKDALLALMDGRGPSDGRQIRAAGGDGSRVAGTDASFSAPKSVSALWAVSSDYHRAQIEAAHRAAVASALARIEREVELVRTRTAGELKWQCARSLVATEFVHTSSRLTRDQESGGVPDPQLHSHVVILAAERMDGRFAAVDSRELFRSARVNGAWYRAQLAQNLQHLSLEVQGRTGRDGRYFELQGVPSELIARWSARSVQIDEASRRFQRRYGREPKGRELESLTLSTRGTKSVASAVEVRDSWQAVAAEHGLTAEQARELFEARELGRSSAQEPLSANQRQELAHDLLQEVTKDRSMVSERELHARVYELAAGLASPEQAKEVVADLERSGELIRLEGGMWTSRELRELELKTLSTVESRAAERAAPVSHEALVQTRRAAARELSGSLSPEQRQALETITADGGVSILVGQAGTGKGVVIGAAADAWRREGYEVIGTAVAGATAERLGADAKLERSLTTDALIWRVEHEQLRLDKSTVVVMDEAAMADTKRLARVVEITAESESKLVLVGDDAQLSAIGAGGLFKEIQEKAPTAELTQVHRAQEQWEREAWSKIRDGQAEPALAQYEAHERLHISDTRQEAAEQMVDAWDEARRGRGEGRCVMITDASNRELDRINAMAQQRRAQHNELGADRLKLADRPYGLAEGDEVIFTASFSPPGSERVHNGTLASVVRLGRDERREPTGEVKLKTRGSEPREVSVDTNEFGELKLAYAQHVYKAQGLTAERAFVLTGGWQTDREHAYVALTRARERTDLYLSREDLGEQGMDAGAIERLGEAIAQSNAQEASVTRVEVGAERGVGVERDTGAEREVRIESDATAEREERETPRLAHEGQERERERGQDLGWGIE